jgi:predicted AAA+ superfamily ATPase
VAISNRDRVGRGFEILARGLEPFVAAHMRAAEGEGWAEAFVARSNRPGDAASLSDAAFQIRVILAHWDQVFSRQLVRPVRNYLFELQGARNRWAHMEGFSPQEAHRVVQTIGLVLEAVDAIEVTEAAAIEQELGQLLYTKERERDEAVSSTVVDAPAKGLAPWRTVVLPHEDVAAGRFNVAEFAADLHLVRLGQGRPEYTDPVEFFRRTYLTAGLRQLLTDAVRRVTGTGGSPVVNLQTNFGGGKTHSLIALYHLFSGVEPRRLPGDVQALVRDAGAERLPAVRRAVLVGTKLPAGQVRTMDDGTEISTMWGELAWQLGGREGYELVADSDRARTNPGDLIRTLFERYGPCLVLIDEWVAYARDLFEKEDLPGGSFETQFGFAQSLTEAARAVDGTLLLVSIPASESIGEEHRRDVIGSDIEVGGASGRLALQRLSAVVSRQAEHWRPATAEESFEIVRRRLFQTLDPAGEAARDATVEAFGQLYRQSRGDFPAECAELRYGERIRAAYPIHPELFDRLYADWSTVERFQRTRGVLRLIASVIKVLWDSDDQSPLILPASLPLDQGPVLTELTRNLEDNWKPVIDGDIDGPASKPWAIDRAHPNLGRYHATRRVARTIFLGSAPTVRSPNRGLDVQRVRLGSCLPGEAVAIFGDALGRLADQAPHLYVDRSRYWFDLQENVTRTARDEAERLLAGHKEEVHEEIVRRLQARGQRGELRDVHVAPRASEDVKDEAPVRLVVLGPESPHLAKGDESPATYAATEILERRGSGPRQFKNALVFAAADHRRLEDLERAVADCLAWSLIDRTAEDRGLDAQQARQAATRKGQADDAVDLRLAEAYQWLLVPTQRDPLGPIDLEPLKLDTQGSVAQRASRKLASEGLLNVQFPPVLLRVQLDGPLASLWADGHVTAGALWDCFAKYVYLPRLRDVDVLLATVAQGPASTSWQSDGFALAHAFDEAAGRYVGLTVGSHPGTVSAATLVVRPDFALGQLEADAAAETGRPSVTVPAGDDDTDEPDGAGRERRPPRRFHGAITLDVTKLSSGFRSVTQEVVDHLTAQVGAEVTVRVDVEAISPDGFGDDVVRWVTENSRTLKFDPASGFEDR